MPFRTPSEPLFAEYLSDRWPWEYEPSIGGTNPDFVVGGQVACDLTAIEARRLPERMGSVDPVQPIRNKIKKKWGQADAARRAGLAFVLVLYQETMLTDLSVNTVAAACFGRLSVQLSIPLDPTSGGKRPPSPLVFGRDGLTEPDDEDGVGGNKGLSAVAILREFNPTLHRLEAALAELASSEGPVDTANHDAMAQRLTARKEIIDSMSRSGTFDPDASTVRLLLVHTRTPEVTLLPGLLGGPYDEEWGIDRTTGRLQLLHQGTEFDSVPGQRP